METVAPGQHTEPYSAQQYKNIKEYGIRAGRLDTEPFRYEQKKEADNHGLLGMCFGLLLRHCLLWI